MSSVLTSIFLILCLNWGVFCEVEWTGTCLTGKKQSPIPICDDEVIFRTTCPIQFVNYYKNYGVELSNTGHGVTLKFVGNQTIPAIFGGRLYGKYNLDNIHFHWNSEHTINGHRYPLEGHFVHYKQKYKNVETALQHDGGVVVLAVFYDISLKNSPDFSTVSKTVPIVSTVINSPVNMDVTPSQFLPTIIDEFYTYVGSLTTPKCNEPISWVIFRNIGSLSRKQYNDITCIQDENKNLLKSNSRPLQSLNGRKVLLNFAKCDITKRNKPNISDYYWYYYRNRTRSSKVPNRYNCVIYVLFFSIRISYLFN